MVEGDNWLILANTVIAASVAIMLKWMDHRWAARVERIRLEVLKETGQLHENVERIHLATNSMKDQLMAATQLAGEAKGRDDERALHARNGLPQGE